MILSMAARTARSCSSFISRLPLSWCSRTSLDRAPGRGLRGSRVCVLDNRCGRPLLRWHPARSLGPEDVARLWEEIEGSEIEHRRRYNRCNEAEVDTTAGIDKRSDDDRR